MPVVAVNSIGEMGLGIGEFLISKGYRVITNLSSRSDRTVQRAAGTSIEDVRTDEAIVRQADYFLSIVPPRDALPMAQRITQALEKDEQRSTPFYYIDLNAISPSTVSKISSVLTRHPLIRYVDGGIIGMPPRLESKAEGMSGENRSWRLPSLPVSGPHKISSPLAADLNFRHISDQWGPASGLKMCFASLTKGFIAIAIQSLTTAESLGILDELKLELANHSLLDRAQAGVAGCPPKAYRWIREMDEIADTFAASGFGQSEAMRGGGLFKAVADVYRFVAEDTTMGGAWSSMGSDMNADSVVVECLKAITRG